MALVKATIKAELVALYDTANSTEMSSADFADAMADWIINTFATAQVNFPIPVQVTPSSGTGATTSIGTLS